MPLKHPSHILIIAHKSPAFFLSVCGLWLEIKIFVAVDTKPYKRRSPQVSEEHREVGLSKILQVTAQDARQCLSHHFAHMLG